jgi:hypothetical protein
LGTTLVSIGVFSDAGTPIIFGVLVLIVAVPVTAATAAIQWVSTLVAVLLAASCTGAFLLLSSSSPAILVIVATSLAGVPRSPVLRIRLASVAMSLVLYALVIGFGPTT